MAGRRKDPELVAQGALTPEEADEILTALNAAHAAEKQAREAPRIPPARHAGGTEQAQAQPRHLRILVTERGRSVVNLRVPMNIAGWASAYLPGLSDENADRIRSAINSGQRGPIIDIGDGDDRVLITSE